MAAAAVAMVGVSSLALVVHVVPAEDPGHLAYSKTIKAPAVRLVNGSETGQFFRDAQRLKVELEALKRR